MMKMTKQRKRSWSTLGAISLVALGSPFCSGQEIPWKNYFAPSAKSIQTKESGHPSTNPQPFLISQDSRAFNRQQTSRHISYRLNAKEGELVGRFVIPTFVEGPQQTLQTGPIQVSLFRQGELFDQVVSDSQGVFRFGDIPMGVYSLVAINGDAMATFGVWVDHQTNTAENILPLIPVNRSISGLDQVAKRFLPQSIWLTEEAGNAKLSPASIRRELISGQFGVRLVGGSLNGQVVDCNDNGETAPVTDAVVNLFQNHVRIADVEVDDQGRFEIPDLEPGFYDLVVVGIDGIAVLRFEALGVDEPLIRRASHGRRPHIIPNVLSLILTPRTVENHSSRFELETELAEFRGQNNGSAGALDPAGQAFSAGGAEGSFYHQNGQFNYAGYGRGVRGSNLGWGRGRLFGPGIIAGSIIAISIRDNPPPASPSR